MRISDVIVGAETASASRISGVRLLPLQMNSDDRGIFTEIFREEWSSGIKPIQWNAVRSEANVLRGVHVHMRHDDYLTVLEGRATVGLRDLRAGSPTEGVSQVIEMAGDRQAALYTPHGVAHGFYFHEPSLHVYAVSHYWDLADELGCFWGDPDLGITWPAPDPKVSERDANLPPLRQLLEEIDPLQPIG